MFNCPECSVAISRKIIYEYLNCRFICRAHSKYKVPAIIIVFGVSQWLTLFTVVYGSLKGPQMWIALVITLTLSAVIFHLLLRRIGKVTVSHWSMFKTLHHTQQRYQQTQSLERLFFAWI